MVRLQLRQMGEETEDMIVYSFWPDVIMIKEIGDPMTVGEYLKLDREEIRARFPAVRTVSTAELAEWIERPTGVQPLLLDVRAPAEFAVSHLPGAILVSSGAQARERLRARTNAGPVVLYCSVGYRSADLADQLQAEGFTNLFNLEGSIFQWANEGRPVFRGNARVEVVHPFDDDWGRLLDRRRWSFVAPTR